jgi:hypothetical protein
MNQHDVMLGNLYVGSLVLHIFAPHFWVVTIADLVNYRFAEKYLRMDKKSTLITT